MATLTEVKGRRVLVAYFMDVMQTSLFPVQFRRNFAYEEIVDAINSRHISHAALGNGDVAIFDGAGLTSGLNRVAEIDGLALPIAGNCIFARMEPDGLLTSPLARIEEVAQLVRIVSPVLERVGAPQAGAAQAGDFQIRLIRQAPRILPERLQWVAPALRKAV